MIAVAMPQDCPNPSSYYMNRMQAIEQFMTGFSIHASDLFESMRQHSVFLPEINRDVNYKSMCIETEKPYSFGDVYITPQERKCLTLKLQATFKFEVQRLLNFYKKLLEVSSSQEIFWGSYYNLKYSHQNLPC